MMKFEINEVENVWFAIGIVFGLFLGLDIMLLINNVLDIIIEKWENRKK